MSRLTESLNNLNKKIITIKSNIIFALNDFDQNVSLSTRLSEIPSIIRRIKVDDGAFKSILNFDIDWRINPKVPRAGQATNGFISFHISDVFNLSVKTFNFESNITNLYSIKTGWLTKDANIVIEPKEEFLIDNKIINMNIQQITEELTPHEDSLN